MSSSSPLPPFPLFPSSFLSYSPCYPHPPPPPRCVYCCVFFYRLIVVFVFVRTPARVPRCARCSAPAAPEQQEGAVRDPRALRRRALARGVSAAAEAAASRPSGAPPAFSRISECPAVLPRLPPGVALATRRLGRDGAAERRSPRPSRGATAARRTRSSRAARCPASGRSRRQPFARASTRAVSGAGTARRRRRRWRQRRRRDGGIFRGSRAAQRRRRRGCTPSGPTAALRRGDAWRCPRRPALARRATTPATTPPATLAAGDLDGLFPVATRPSRRHATATMTATPRRGRAWWWGGAGCGYGSTFDRFGVQKSGSYLK